MMPCTAVCASSAAPQQMLLPVHKKADLRTCLGYMAFATCWRDTGQAESSTVCFCWNESACCWLAERGHGSAERDWHAPQAGD